MAQNADTYDFIIIGGGTAGCLVANRLSSAFPTLSILMIEAGKDRRADKRVLTPGLSKSLWTDDTYSWGYETTRQDGLNGRTISQPRGKLLGGTSAINSFALIYPSRNELDAWAVDFGNPGWAWDDMKLYFRSFQEIHPPTDIYKEEALPIVSRSEQQPTTTRTGDGGVEATLPFNPGIYEQAWIETFREMGMENVNEPLEGDALGGYISTCHITHDTHERSHSATAFLNRQTTMRLPNLKIITGAIVERIVFAARAKDQQSGGSNDLSISTATAVEYVQNGINCVAYIAKEVILTAGVFGSPQILERSGVGSPSILNSHGIKIVEANPNVGQHLQDHIRIGLSFEAREDVGLARRLSPEEASALYDTAREGPLAQGCCTFAQIPLTPFLNRQSKQELEEHFESGQTSNDNILENEREFIRKVTLSNTDASATIYMAQKPAIEGPGNISSVAAQPRHIGLFSMLSYPLSRGSVHIASKDAKVKPKIEANYYDNPLDLHIHARHLDALRVLINTEPLKGLTIADGEKLPANIDSATFDSLKQICADYAGTNYHPCGTCRMMPRNKTGVVSPRLKVYGTSNVRVIDASIFPLIPRGNIVTMVYATAEKGASMIIADWGTL